MVEGGLSLLEPREASSLITIHHNHHIHSNLLSIITEPPSQQQQLDSYNTVVTMMHNELPLVKSFYNSDDSPSLSIHKQAHELTCFESYQLFKKCSSRSRGTEGFNCKEVVGTYMKCAMGVDCRF